MQITTYGLDLAKTVMQLHWVDMETGEIHRKQVKRQALLEFFVNRQPGIVAMEACGSAHYWARELRKLGHEVRLVADAQEESGLRVVNAVLVEIQATLHIVIGGRRKTRGDLADEDRAATRAGCRIWIDDGESCAREFFNGLWIQRHFSVSPSRMLRA